MTRNDKRLDKLLLRRLHGELTARDARKLEELEELENLEAGEPAVRQRSEELRAVWDELAPPPASPAPDLLPELMSIVRETQDEVHWSMAPPWTRAAAAMVLMLGVALGTLVGEALEPLHLDGEARTAAPATEPPTGEDDLIPETPSLVDAYRQVLEETNGRLGELERNENDPETDR